MWLSDFWIWALTLNLDLTPDLTQIFGVNSVRADSLLWSRLNSSRLALLELIQASGFFLKSESQHEVLELIVAMALILKRVWLGFRISRKSKDQVTYFKDLKLSH